MPVEIPPNNALTVEKPVETISYTVTHRIGKVFYTCKPLILYEGFDPTKYSKFIEGLKNLREQIGGTISHQYVPEPESHPCWLDIPLIYGDKSVVLRVDARNLYVRGYYTNKNTQFWEFSDSSLIHGAKPLPYSGSLLRDDGLCSAASKGFHLLPGSTPVEFLQFISVGYSRLLNAIVSLVNKEPYLNPSHSARYLLCIILMITEAARFKFIAEYVFESWWNPLVINLDIQSALTAMSMGTFSANESYLVGWFRSGTSIESIVCEGSSRGLSVVSIYYVLVKHICGPNKPRKIYGTVKLLDVYRKILHTVFDRTLADPEIKRQGEKLSLSTSFKLVDGDEPFCFQVCLSDTDGVIAEGNNIIFDEMIGSPLDKHLERSVLGKRGEVAVGFSVIEYPLCAVIDVVMINNHDVESSPHVYGNITACYHLLYSKSPTRMMLFEKSKNDCVRVSSQQPIPLTGQVFPVSVVGSSLTISVCLWDRDSLSLIPCGSLEFLPVVGTQLKNIIGEHQQVQVSVTCLPI